MAYTVEINGRDVEFDNPPTDADIDAAAEMIRQTAAPSPAPRLPLAPMKADVEEPLELEEPEREAPGLARRAAAFGVRTAAPIIGGMVGLATPVPGGALIGAGLGGAAGESAARWIEGEEQSLKAAGVAAGLSVIPAGPAARMAARATTTGARLALGAVEGAAQGALATGAQKIIVEGETPTVGDVAAGAAGGAVLGAAIRGGTDWFAKRQVRDSIHARINDAAQRMDDDFVGPLPEEPAVAPEPGTPEPGTPEPAAALAPDGAPEGDVPASTHPFRTLRGAVAIDPLASPVPPEGPMPIERVARAKAAARRYMADRPADELAEVEGAIDAMPDLVEAQTRGVQPDVRRATLARRVMIDPDDLIPAGTTAQDFEVQALADTVAALTAKGRALGARVLADSTDEVAAASLSRTYQQITNMTLGIIGIGSEAGRTLRAGRFIKGRLTPAAQMGSFITKAGRMHGVSPTDIAAALERAGDDPLHQYRELLALARLDWRQRAGSYYILNLLTNPKTLERNLFGNIVRTIEDPIMRPMAGAWDAIRAGVTGQQRRVYADEGLSMVVGAKKSFPDAVRAMLEVFKQGYSTEQAVHQITSGRFEFTPEPFAGGAKNPYNLISRLLEGPDQFFRTLSKGMQRDALALYNGRRLAIGELRSGLISRNQLRARTAAHAADLSAEYATNPPDEIAEQASRSVFREDNPRVQRLQSWISEGSLPFRAGMRLLLPFIKTPANIIKQGFEHSPLGYGMRGSRAGDRYSSVRQAEATVGTVVAGGAVWLAANGLISGAAPQEPGARNAFYDKHPPYSIKTPWGWRSYQELGPIVVPLGAAANAVQGWQSVDAEPTEDDAGELVSTILTKLGRSGREAGRGILDRSFLSTMSSLMNATTGNDPDGWQRFFSQLGASFVPGQGLGRAMVQYESDVVRAPRGLVQKVRALVPDVVSSEYGQSTIPPRLDAAGRVVRRPTKGPSSLLLSSGDEPISEPDMVLDEVRRVTKRNLAPHQRDLKGLLIGTRRVKLDQANDLAYRAAKGQARRALLVDLFNSDTYYAAPEDNPDVKGSKQKLIKSAEIKASTAVKKNAIGLLGSGTAFTVERLLRGVAPVAEEVIQFEDATPERLGALDSILNALGPSEAAAAEVPEVAAREQRIAWRKQLRRFDQTLRKLGTEQGDEIDASVQGIDELLSSGAMWEEDGEVYSSIPIRSERARQRLVDAATIWRQVSQAEQRAMDDQAPDDDDFTDYAVEWREARGIPQPWMTGADFDEMQRQAGFTPTTSTSTTTTTLPLESTPSVRIIQRGKVREATNR